MFSWLIIMDSFVTNIAGKVYWNLLVIILLLWSQDYKCMHACVKQWLINDTEVTITWNNKFKDESAWIAWQIKWYVNALFESKWVLKWLSMRRRMEEMSSTFVVSSR